MPVFTALNVEPDENPEDDIDNTRDIQIEESLKLYQTALKLHSQGPQYYNEAAAAYKSLFNSEIFQYPESVLDFTRSLEAGADFEHDLTYSLESEIAATGSDGTPSTLPQILYLAHKNCGQFVMDSLRYKGRGANSVAEQELLQGSKLALEHFTQALSWDESDTELWRRASRIGALLGSQRIARYCLEAAVEVDDDPTAGEVDPMALEEGFAGIQLKEHLEVLSDQVALSHPIMVPYTKKNMSDRLRKYIDPYPFLPAEAINVKGSHPQAFDRVVIELPERSWCALGDALWQTAVTYESSGAGIAIQLPPDTKIADAPQIQEPVSIVKDSTPSSTEPVANEATQNHSEDTEEPSTLLQQIAGNEAEIINRKRSVSVAGIRGTPEDESGAQKRSKRLRNKDPSAPDIMTADPAAQYKHQLHEFSEGDYHMFHVVGTLLERLGVNELGNFEGLQATVSTANPLNREDQLRETAIWDLQEILNSWDERKAQMFALGNGVDVMGASSGDPRAGLATFLEHSKKDPQKVPSYPLFPPAAGLATLVESINTGWMPIQDVVYEFFKAIRDSYRQSLWSEALKLTLIRLMTQLDSALLDRLQDEAQRLVTQDANAEDRAMVEEYTLMIFELHLDLYASITNPSSVVGHSVRVEQRESLDRWASLCGDLLQKRECGSDDEISLRYLWASVLYAAMSDGSSREHILLLWADLQKLLQESGESRIELQNNLAMPEISAAAADREISRLTTMDFFIGLFRVEQFDALTIIETLEPVLDPSSVKTSSSPESADTSVVEDPELVTPKHAATNAPSLLRDMWKFLEGGSVALRLFLWQRLREAYENIEYHTKVFSCHLRSIEIILADIQSPTHVDASAESRQSLLLNWLRTLDGLIVKALAMALNDTTAYDIVDNEHIKSSTSALAKLARMLHTVALFDDKLQLGVIQLPSTVTFATQGTFASFLARMQEIQVRCWTLIYAMVKEGMSQNKSIFPTMDNDLADYLAGVHYSLGLRKACKASNKIFIKMMRVELVRLKHVEKWEDYLGQVLYDLYGVRLGAGVYELQEHGCPTEALDRQTAFSIMEQVTTLANRMTLKDLQKSELRSTIERMQQAIGPLKQTLQMSHNLRNYSEYLKKSIDPLHMYQALKGQISIDNVPVVSGESVLTDRSWYFLLGNMALTKFRSQKRLAAGAIDDLRVAVSFFRLQIQFTSEHWETWYRLAQCFDAELEEDVMWSADKLNSDRGHIAQLQRSSIHCYMMAVSTALRSADAQFETASKISDMYHDFGVRLYSSSRDPFGMEAFYMDGFDRHFSGPQGMYTKVKHMELTRFKVWRFAAQLFRRALVEKPSYWLNHFMLGKCLWKMYRRVDEEPDLVARDSRPSMDLVIKTFTKAIETVPKPRDSRAEPILDPHYKLISIVHKLIRGADLEPQAGADLLQEQPYAVRKGEKVVISDVNSWETFILESIRHVRNADKSNWHHRMIARTAHIVYPEGLATYDQAAAGRAELMKSMFTKTMQINVWRPEFERAGRHCVYTERYVRYMVRMLLQLNDKANLEALAKRVRKKGADIFRFENVWIECCLAYGKLIRMAGEVPMNQDDFLKNIHLEDFNNIATVLQQWVDSPGSTHPSLDVLKEAQELKKLNMNLMKPAAPLDDLISDAYAGLVLQVGVHLPRPPPVVQPPVEARPPPPPPTGPMSLNNLVSNMDGTSSPVFIDETVRLKPKVVGRREILRRAEALMTRILEVPRPVPSNSRPRQSDIGGQPMGSGRNSDAGLPADQRKEAGRNDEEADGDSSAPGSVHDSADDESDLSDAPDLEESLIFPNLAKNGSEAGSTPAATSGDI